MESPDTSNKKLGNGDTIVTKTNSPPANQRITEEFSLYYLHRDSSPSLRAGQDILEVGWGNSPEPLNLEKKSALTKTPITCKKKLESKESPVSSISSKKRNLRSNMRISSRSILDISKYVAEVQELSKSIMKELNSNKSDKDGIENKNNVKNCIASPSLGAVTKQNKENIEINICNIKQESSTCQIESSFDNIIQKFISEEDDWLSQALSCQESMKPISKISFLKCKSENELSLSQPNIELKMNTPNKNASNSFRRTGTFDMAGSPKHISALNNNNNNLGNSVKSNENISKEPNDVSSKIPQTQYSQQEIERKRLEAIYRRERKEIERKKMEALRRLETKKLRIQT